MLSYPRPCRALPCSCPITKCIIHQPKDLADDAVNRDGCNVRAKKTRELAKRANGARERQPHILKGVKTGGWNTIIPFPGKYRGF